MSYPDLTDYLQTNRDPVIFRPEELISTVYIRSAIYTGIDEMINMYRLVNVHSLTENKEIRHYVLWT